MDRGAAVLERHRPDDVRDSRLETAHNQPQCLLVCEPRRDARDEALHGVRRDEGRAGDHESIRTRGNASVSIRHCSG